VLGVLLRELLEAVLDDPSLNQRAALLTIAANFYRTRLAAEPDGPSAVGAD
jgi:hypothetical protein